MSTFGTKGQPARTPEPQRVDISADKSLGERKTIPENRGSQPSVNSKVDDEAKKPRYTFLDNMDAIASGVQARFEENSGYSKRVTEATVDIARALGIPEAEIERWTDSRLTRLVGVTKKLREIKSLLEGLQGSFPDSDKKRRPRRKKDKK